MGKNDFEIILNNESVYQGILLMYLSESLTNNCDVLINYGNSDESLGVVSHKCLVYFLVEFLEFYFYKVFDHDYKSMHKEYLYERLKNLRVWIDSSEKYTIESDHLKHFIIIEKNCFIKNLSKSIHSCCRLASECKNSSYRISISLLISISKMLENDTLSDKERYRQSEFIIDFLKSGKHLFMLE